MFNLTKYYNNVLDFFSRKLGMNLRHLISWILSKFYSNKIDENLLVFGSTNGQAFAGNSKVLFEYLCNHSSYQCVWITASDKVVNNLEKQNYQVVLNKNIIQTVKLLKAAKYIFITHGFGDIFYINFSPDTKLIYLGHGISFKKGGHDRKESYIPFTEKKMNQKLVDSMNIMIDSSEETKRHKMTTYGLKSKKILVTGYPRNDILLNYNKDLVEKIKINLNIKNENQIILYAPTFREYPYELPLNEEFLMKLNKFLVKENKILIYKPHPFTEEINLSRYKSIISVKRNIDINDLLIIADILITDYSSVFYDYLLTLRPIIFFADDLERYTEVRDFYYNYKTFVPGPFVSTGDELIYTLKTLEEWNPIYEVKRRSMRDQFNKYVDGHSTERIIDVLNLKLNKH